MLYVLTGDIGTAKARAEKLSRGSVVVRFGEGGEMFANALGYLGARGLFASKTTLILDRPLDDTDGKILITGHSKELGEAEALVVVIEHAIPAPILKLVSKVGTVEQFDVPMKRVEPAPSAFALADAFALGDRKNSWIRYRELIGSGTSAEEIHGILSWQVRAMVVASKAHTPEEAGLKPFVYSKAKKAGARLGVEGCEEVSRRLMHMVHQSRMGGGNLGDLLEAFLLKKY